MKRRAFLRRTLSAGAGAGVLGTAAPVMDPFLPDAGRWDRTDLPRDDGPRGGAEDPLRLSSNENPLGPPPSAVEALGEAATGAHRYGFDQARELRGAIARHHGIDPEWVVLGYGSTELLRMAVRDLAQRGGRIVTAEPTFRDIHGYAEGAGVEVEEVPLREDWAHDLEAMRRAARRTDGPTLVYVCNPNNPTGTLTPTDELEAWVTEAGDDVLFVVDEAYHEYVEDPGYRSAEVWLSPRENVLAVRTFSKVYGLAGLRVGYGLAPPGLANRLSRHATRYLANGPSLEAARAALEDRGFVQESRRTNREGLAVLDDALEDLGLERLPTHGNFAMFEVPGDLEDFIQRMLDEENIRVGRPFPPLLGYNRLTIGRPEDMERVGGALRRFRREGWI